MDFVSSAFLRRPATTHRHIPGTDAGFPTLVNKLRAKGIVRAKEGEVGKRRGMNRKLVLKCTSEWDSANFQAVPKLGFSFSEI